MKRRVAAVLACLAVLAVPSGAQAAERLPEGTTIAGVAVGGLGPIGAERELRRVLAQQLERPITVRISGRDRAISTQRAGLTVEYDAMVKKAFELADRNRRNITVRLDRTFSSKKLDAAVRWAQRPWYRAPRNARVKFGVTKVIRIRHRFGRGIDAKRFRAALAAELRAPTANRVVLASVRRLTPRVTLRELSRVHHTYVSIDRGNFKLRLFKRLRHVRTYGIAIGAAGFDTPRGLRRIVSRERNPAWHAPNKPWAGQFAGQTIPPGDPRNPLKAWFLSLGGGYGIHGTAEEWSIGTRASHGCIRMRVRDVKLLAPRVSVGTPVLIR